MRFSFLLTNRSPDKMITCHIVTYNIHGLPWPWIPNKYLELSQWLTSLAPLPQILCLQEVFTAGGKQTLKQVLERVGYHVLFPMDEGVTLLTSGLVVAVRHFEVLSSFFCPYLVNHNFEIFANKGFFRIRLRDPTTGRRFSLVNTHTQSDDGAKLFGKAFLAGIRYKQAEQLLDLMSTEEDPVLVVGDLNQESSLHPYLRSLHPPSVLPIKKTTFFSTGEDLDHVAWLPLQWAPDGVGFCHIHTKGPQLLHCKVHDVSYSDHAPVEMRVIIPPFQKQGC
jgi:endonuclease/exonuclease/phosphatase family metal-dependent hydrolase